VATRTGLVPPLPKVDIEFGVGPVDHTVKALKQRGVETTGIMLSAKYANLVSKPCSFSVPVAGFGTLDVAMEIGPMGCIHAQRASGDLF
jgi:PDZ domain-containing secreted protein